MRRIFTSIVLLLMMAGFTAKAEWVQPDLLQYKVTEIVPSENPNGNLYHLYEVNLETFFSQGNKWGGEASLDNSNPKTFFFSKYVAEDGEWDGISYRMNNWVTNKSIWDDMFVVISGDWTYIASDCTMGQGIHRGDDSWCFEWTENGTAKIYVSDHSTTRGETELGYRAYMATADFPATTRIGLTIPEVFDLEFTQVLEWVVLDASAYNAELSRYNKALELIAAIQAAEEEYADIDMSSVQAVYDNTNSTLEELQAALDSIPEIIQAYIISTFGDATIDNPVDLTMLLSTPDYAVGNANGWEGDKADIVGGSAQLYNKETFDFYQHIKNIPNGVYRINVQGLFRIGWEVLPIYEGGVCRKTALQSTYVYGESNGLRLRSRLADIVDDAESTAIHNTDREYGEGKFVPGSQHGFTAWADLGYYSDNETYVLVTDSTLRLGLYNNNAKEGWSWCVFDNWTLAYCGTAEDACEKLREQMMDFIEFDESKLQTALREEYTAKIAAIEAATTTEELMAANEGLTELQDIMSLNLLAFDDYIAAVAEVKAYLEEHNDFVGPNRTFLEEYLESDAAPGDYPNGGYFYIVENTLLSSAQLAEEIVYVQQLLETAIHTSISEGTDITNLLVNPNMALPNYEGWTNDHVIDRDYDSGMGRTEFPVAQANWTPFDLSQTLEDMPDGVYELNVNAFTRWGGDWAGQDDKVVPVVLYLNEFSTPIQNITSDMVSEDEAVNMENCYNTKPGTHPYDRSTERDGKTYYAPNSVDGASYAFRAGRYKQTVYGLVIGGKLTVGMRDTRESSTEWNVFSNFKLTYQGKNPEIMASVLTSLQQRADAYQTAAVNRGISFYQGYYAEIQTQAETFNAAEETETKYNALIAINDMLEKIAVSVDLYEKIEKKLDEAYSAYWEKMDILFTLEEIEAFEQNIYHPTTEALQQGTLNNEEAMAKLEEVRMLPSIDIVYVFGDLVGQEWGSTTSIYPMLRQADGTYQGEFEALTRTSVNDYANRSAVYFSYQGESFCSANPYKRDVAGNTRTYALGTGSTAWFSTYGGKWKATITADFKNMTFEPVSEPVYPEYLYVVGDIEQGYWAFDKNVPLAHQGNGMYSGVITVGNTDGRFTIFGGAWSIANNKWTEARLGTGDGTVDLPLGEEVSGVSRFYNDAAWHVEPGTYTVTLDYGNLTIKIAPVGEDGIRSVTDKKDNAKSRIYNINGIRVEKTKKGLYIIDGKKVMVK